MEFRPLTVEEQKQLGSALAANAGDGAALLQDRRTTRFIGHAPTLPDEMDNVVAAIRAVPCHYADERLVAIALGMLPEYLDDARAGAPMGNSVIGSLLSLQHGAPRQYAEEAVREAIRRYDAQPKPLSGEEEEFTLPRTGKPPLKFRGRLLAESDGERATGRDQNRWHELAVYSAGVGPTGLACYVVRIAYRTRWQGELDHDYATVVETAEMVTSTFSAHSPANDVRGYPPGDAYAERQARLVADVQERYLAQVSEVLSADEFAERLGATD